MLETNKSRSSTHPPNPTKETHHTHRTPTPFHHKSSSLLILFFTLSLCACSTPPSKTDAGQIEKYNREPQTENTTSPDASQPTETHPEKQPDPERTPEHGAETSLERTPETPGESTPEPHRESPPEQPTQNTGCNGHKDLCDRRYDQVVYPTTHNAMSNKQDGWTVPNQNKNMTRQMNDGIRALMLDVHNSNGTPTLCHGSNSAFCALGNLPLVDGLKLILNFMNTHPNEIISIIFESYVSAQMMETAFKNSKLLPLAYAHTKGQPWPTLRTLIQQKKRLVVFTDREGGKFPWYHNVWSHAWETHYSAKSSKDFSCKKNRGDLANPLFIFNHFLTNPFASESLAKSVNFNPSFLARAKLCQTESGRLPNFVTVDFYSIGDLFSVVKELNGIK